MRSNRLKAFGILLMALGISGLLAFGFSAHKVRYSSEDQVAVGSILFATEKLSDPNFYQAVILIVQFDPDHGAEGVVINRQTEIPISRIFPKAKHALKDPVYLGGPVEVTGLQALMRLSENTEKAVHVVGDVYVTGSSELMEKSIDAEADSSKFRLYVGYAGWAPGQLDAEIRLGAWSVKNGSSKVIFDPNPDSLWQRLTRESHMRMAALRWFEAAS